MRQPNHAFQIQRFRATVLLGALFAVAILALTPLVSCSNSSTPAAAPQVVEPAAPAAAAPAPAATAPAEAPKKAEPASPVRLFPVDPKKPLKCLDIQKPNCTENADGSVTVHEPH
jgi:hypothetical protein